MKTSKQKDYLIIDRSKWKTGTHGEGYSALLNAHGYLSCLGFRCYQMGIPKIILFGKGLPEDIDEYDIPGLINDNGYNTDLSDNAASINDCNTISDDERETLLINLFAKYDITVEFKGKYKHPSK